MGTVQIKTIDLDLASLLILDEKRRIVHCSMMMGGWEGPRPRPRMVTGPAAWVGRLPHPGPLGAR